MNFKERKCINNIDSAKSKIKKAKEDYTDSIQFMDKLLEFAEQYIQVDGMKNLKTEVTEYKKKIKKNNDNLDILDKRLDKQNEKIKEISKLREEAEKFGN